jgi:hypothetical protein
MYCADKHSPSYRQPNNAILNIVAARIFIDAPAELHDVCRFAEQIINIAVQSGQALDVRQLVQ